MAATAAFTTEPTDPETREEIVALAAPLLLICEGTSDIQRMGIAKGLLRPTATVGSNGRWTFRYRVPRALRGTYRFRAVIQPSPNYPYSKRTSHSRRLTVTR